VNMEDRHRECLLPILLDTAGPHVPPDRMIVELTTIPSRQTLRTLKHFGFRVALDDLGREAFPLDLICEDALDMVKFDKGMMTSIHRPAHRALLGGLTHMLMGLGKDTVAEGIETQEQRQVASDLGVTYLQGYLMRAPAPVAEAHQKTA